MSARRLLASMIAVGVLVLVAGCGGSDTPPQPPRQRVVVAELNTSDSEVAGELYRRLLDQAGYATSVRKIGARELYVEPLATGTVQVVADYASSAAAALADSSGAGDGDAGSPDEQTALATLSRLAGEHGISVLRPTRAEVGTQYVVTADLARRWGLRTLSDLAAARNPVSLAAAPDCLPSRDCTQGLEQTYGIRLDRVTPLEGDTLTALRGGSVQVAQVTSTDPALDSPDLVALVDDKSLVNAENLVPMATTSWLRRQARARTAMNRLAAVLTTADLRAMVTRVAQDGQPTGDVVQEYLTQKGLV
jgi:osmoprotectant transport system substrate-binding protein